MRLYLGTQYRVESTFVAPLVIFAFLNPQVQIVRYLTIVILNPNLQTENGYRTRKRHPSKQPVSKD